MTGDLQVSLPSGGGVATYPSGATFGPREMHDYEFVWIVEGDAEYRWGDQAVAAPEGSVVLCRPGVTDFFRWDPLHVTRHAYYHFHLKRWPRSWPAQSRWPLVRLPVEGDILRPLFRYLLTWLDRGNPLQIRLAICQMVCAFVTGEITAADVPHDVLPEPVELAMAHLRQRLEADPAQPVTLQDLARAGAVTREHLCRLFVASTGRSPARTVHLARLDRAAMLLTRSNFTVGQVARMCGFSNPFHFSRCFSRAFEQSPRAMRKAVQAGATVPVTRLLRQL